jgi:hypothetical protein
MAQIVTVPQEGSRSGKDLRRKFQPRHRKYRLVRWEANNGVNPEKYTSRGIPSFGYHEAGLRQRFPFCVIRRHRYED